MRTKRMLAAAVIVAAGALAGCGSSSPSSTTSPSSTASSTSIQVGGTGYTGRPTDAQVRACQELGDNEAEYWQAFNGWKCEPKGTPVPEGVTVITVKP